MSDSADFSTMTLAQIEALAERFGAAVRTINEARALLGGELGASGRSVARPMVSSLAAPVAPGPFPCAACGRVATERPGEVTQPAECLTCGNHLPVVAGGAALRQSNKGPLVMDPEMLARRQALIATPAFDDAGEPT